MYTIDPVEETAKKEVIEGKTQWSVKYELKDHTNKIIGDGILMVECLEQHEHIANEKAFSTLVRAGAQKIKKDIEKERMLTNQKYEIGVKSCSHLL